MKEFRGCLGPYTFLNFGRKSVFKGFTFFVFVNTGAYVNKKLKMILLLQIAANSFQTSPKISSQWFSQTTLGMLEILNVRFLTFFLRKFTFSCMEKPKTSTIWNTSDRRAKQSDMWDSQAEIEYIWGTFGIVAFKVILESFSALAVFFSKLHFPKTLLLVQITAESYQTSPKLFSELSSQNCVWDFFKF